MTATGMLVFGYDLGGPGAPLGWKIPTTASGHPAVDWYDPADPHNIGFGEQAAAHLITLKGETPAMDGLDRGFADDLWGVHLVDYGSEGAERWLVVSYRTDASERSPAQRITVAELVEHEPAATQMLRAALDALGIPEPGAPQWYVAARES
ncbi:hypothetical protein SAMN05421874_128114 [Nonomuraea maritima]|uniref:Uncharacterized protein n=1 Tax=Nonomuraea maritima TaxID=683260 RepID=A0A1G9MPB0_9ACTN|nr:hypothetical protein [Nonomuraea maritima]SDL75747.1 hypothetical protein SAMN05421874_128114 [Nonomuraea maritima]